MEKMNIDEALKRKLSERLTPKPKIKTIYTTFKLSQQGHDAIRTLSGSEGKNADVFDLIIEAVAALGEAKVLSTLPKALDGELSRKTYVVKRDTLAKIGEIAKNGGIDRDVVVENICKLLEFLHKEKKLKDNVYLDLIDKKISLLINQFDSLEKEAAEQLGDDDPSCQSLSMISDFAGRLSSLIKQRIKTGESFDPMDIL